LVTVARVLTMMDEKLDCTEKLSDALLAQETVNTEGDLNWRCVSGEASYKAERSLLPLAASGSLHADPCRGARNPDNCDG
jgi:hypothetical protein